jgi:CxxC motif-containing protein (DUF1111 family)
MIQGEAIQVHILEVPGQNGMGKCGWKDQDPTILSFSGDAYLNEMGVYQSPQAERCYLRL